LKPVHQLFTHPPTSAEGFADQRDFPRERKADAQGRKKVRHQLRNHHLAKKQDTVRPKNGRHVGEIFVHGLGAGPNVHRDVGKHDEHDGKDRRDVR
jgi:hypothetical protein